LSYSNAGQGGAGGSRDLRRQPIGFNVSNPIGEIMQNYHLQYRHADGSWQKCPNEAEARGAGPLDRVYRVINPDGVVIGSVDTYPASLARLHRLRRASPRNQ